MSITGDRDRPPVRISPPQSWLNAAADSAGAVLIALHERRRSGLGQHVDTSAQQSFADCSQFQMMAALVGAEIPRRLPGAVQLGDYLIPWVYECADGYVTITFLFGAMVGPFSARLVGWLHDEGFVDDRLRDMNWIEFGLAVLEGRESIETFDEVIEAIRSFARTKTKAELLARALQTNLLIAPVTTTADVMALEQLAEREYWDELTIAGRDGPRTVRFPGPIARFSEYPAPLLPASPQLGSASIDVIGDRRRPEVVVAATAPVAGERPLADVKVLDFMWAMAGPGTTRVLADYGATVVKIETEAKAGSRVDHTSVRPGWCA